MYTFFVVSLFISSAINLSLVIYAVCRFKTVGAVPFAGLLTGMFILSFSSGYSAICPTIEEVDFWFNRIRFLGFTSIPVFLFLFSLSMDARKSLITLRNTVMLFILPLITMVFVFTNHNHHLFIESINYRDINGLIFRGAWEPGIWFWVHSIYSYILLVSALIVLFLAVLRKPHPYKGQAVLMFVGAFVPILANLVVISRIFKNSGLDLTAFCFTLSGIVIGYALFRYRLLDIMPIARDFVVESIKDLIIVLDRQNRVVDLNPSALNRLFFVSKNVVGEKIQDIFAEELNFEELISSQPLNNFEIELGLRNGEKALFDLAISKLTNRGKAWVGTLLVARDITELKRLQNQVMQRHKMDAVSTLAGGIAHQFNNQLLIITGNVELIQRGTVNKRNITAINRSVKRMTRLTSLLLASARGGKYYETVTSVKDLVSDVLPLLKYDIDPVIKIKTDFIENNYKVNVDHLQMQIVISAIFNNACEAITKEGMITISCNNLTVDPDDLGVNFPGLTPGDYAILKIKDNGKGMDQEVQKKIFDPFFTTNFQGRGLSMAAVYGIIKNHKGYISIDSEPGKGTCVTLYLPKFKEDVSEPKKQSAVKSMPTKTGSHILVIEDEKDICDVTRKYLEKMGHHVIEARTGEEAIKIAQTFDGMIELALLDILLPDMSGDAIYPLLKKIRPDIKVIICSGYSIDGPVQETLDAGAEDFLQKPYAMAVLSEKLNKYLS